MPTEESYDDDAEYAMLSDFVPKRRKLYIRESAWELLTASMAKGEVISAEEAFTLAESFVAEAQARGY